jgi:6-phosphofructokinase 2
MKGPIVTITLSPCIDKSTRVDRFIPEKKLKCSYPILEAGGGGINVSKVLKNFRMPSRCIYVSGGYTGKLLDLLIYHEGLKAVPVISLSNTRENFIVFENQTHFQFRFGMPVNKLSRKEWKDVLVQMKKIKPSCVVLSGSVHADLENNFFTELYAYIRKQRCCFIADTSGKALQKIVATGAFLIKPNQNEFSALFGKQTLSVNAIIEKARALVKKGKIQNIVVSLGKNGAVLVNKEEVYSFTPPDLEIKSTVGAGDSMVAAIVYAMENGKSVVEAVRFGIAAGAATTINSGMRLCSLSGARKLFSKVKVKTII